MKTVRDDKEFYSTEGKKPEGGDYVGGYSDKTFKESDLAGNKSYKPDSKEKN